MTTIASSSAWKWLLGKTRNDLWRYVSYQDPDPGPGQNPRDEPRVEVIRQLIAYPQEVFEQLVQAIAANDSRGQSVRWLSYREPGPVPTRPYWICFVSAYPAGGRRFHFGLELFDRSKIGLWFFSGYSACPDELLTPFPSNPELKLPRLLLSPDNLAACPLAEWVEAAWQDRLTFSLPASPDSVATPQRSSMGGSADQSHVINASLVDLPLGEEAEYHLVGLRASRARLISCPEKGEITLHPIARLTTVIGRDPRCDVVFDDRRVSAEHARIAWRQGVPEIEELDSKNGTVLAGVTLRHGRAVRLPAEGLIELGGLKCLFVLDSEDSSGSSSSLLDARLETLLEQGRLQPETLESARQEAQAQGITPAEVLLVRRKLTLEDWMPARSKGCAGALLPWLPFAASLLNRLEDLG